MLSISRDHIHIDHVMWQPNISCENKCRACYLKDYPHKDSSLINTEILDLIFETKEISCDQLTISLNSFPTDKIPKDLLSMLTKLVSDVYSKREMWPQLYLTFHTLRDLINYGTMVGYQLHPERMKEATSKWEWNMAEGITLILQAATEISISTPVDPQVLRGLRMLSPCVRFMYNKVIGEKPINKSKILKECEPFDWVYLIAEKKPWGEYQDLQISRKIISNWNNAAIILKDTNKLFLDTCIYEYVGEGTCSAGTSRIHIWPDNAVTGCPYDSRLNTTPPYIGGQLKEIIREAVLNPFVGANKQNCIIHEALRGSSHSPTAVVDSFL